MTGQVKGAMEYIGSVNSIMIWKFKLKIIKNLKKQTWNVPISGFQRIEIIEKFGVGYFECAEQVGLLEDCVGQLKIFVLKNKFHI